MELTLSQVAIRNNITEEEVKGIMEKDKTFYNQWVTEIDGSMYFTQRAACRITRDYKDMLKTQEKEQAKQEKEKEKERAKQMQAEIGARLKEARVALNLSIEKFGEKAGLNKSAIYGLESGKRAFTPELFTVLCLAHSINQKWLENGEGDMFVENEKDRVAPADIMPAPEPVEEAAEDIVPTIESVSKPVPQKTKTSETKRPAAKRPKTKRLTKAFFENGENEDIRAIREFYIKNGLCPLSEIAASSDEAMQKRFSEEYVMLEYNETLLAVDKEAFLGILSNIYKMRGDE